MICYLDRAWCTRSVMPRECGNVACSRYIQDHDFKHADTIGLPFSLSDFKSSCGAFIPITTTPEDSHESV